MTVSDTEEDEVIDVGEPRSAGHGEGESLVAAHFPEGMRFSPPCSKVQMTALETPILTLDTLLRRIAAELRLSDPLRDLAERRYNSVAEWLLAPGSPLAAARPHIYPQGSLRMQSTVRSRGAQEAPYFSPSFFSHWR